MRIKTFHSIGTAVLAVYALSLTAFASDIHPVTRPVNIKAAMVLMVSLDPATLGEAVGIGEGQASHLGRFVLHAAGSFDFETSEFAGEGFLTMANGDSIHFKMRHLGGVEFIGGTGRLENSTGGHTIELTGPPEQRIVDGQLMVAFSYTGQGTITYQRPARCPTRPGSPGDRVVNEQRPDYPGVNGSRRWERRRSS
jgi:hypothetical protein